VVLLSLCAVVWVSCGMALKFTPIVLMHGITADSSVLGHVVDALKQYLPGVYILNVEIGDGWYDSLFWSMNYQLAQFCKTVKSDPNLAGGFNIMGFSQGGVIARGYLERCNDPPVKNFVSWSSPQMGVYGVPNVGHIKYLNWTLDALADCCVYDRWVQDIMSWAGYWRDPFALDDYLQNCLYLPDLNNERPTKNQTYKKNVLNLENFIMGLSTVDMTLIPRESSWFGTYVDNSDTKVIKLEDLPMYKEDWIGLRKLQETGRLKRFTTNCHHGDYFTSCFDKYFVQYVVPFLKNSTIP